MASKTSPQKSVFISVRWLLIAGFIVQLTVIMAGIFYWFYQLATQQAISQVKRDLTQTVQTTALNVDIDELLSLSKEGEPNAAGVAWQEAEKGETARQTALEQFGPPLAAGFSDDPRYQRLLNWLETIHKIEPRAWPYLWVNGESTGEIIYVADLSARYNPQKSALFLERQGNVEATTKLELSTDADGHLESYTDEWGEWYSAWIPLKDSSDQIIGAVGVDFVAGEVDQIQLTIRNIVLGTFAFSYIIMFLAVFLISRIITEPILALTRAANAVGEGDYEQDFTRLYGGKFFHNEIGALAHVFSLMVDKIQERVENLQQQVVNLRIEIDQAKRQNQVNEIINTDFFRELQARIKAERDKQDSLNSEGDK
jgi:HAMP domain-containing protein